MERERTSVENLLIIKRLDINAIISDLTRGGQAVPFLNQHLQ